MSASDSLRHGRSRAWNELGLGRTATEEAWQQSLPELMKGLLALEGGYDAALGEVANVGAAAKQRTIDRGEQLVGSVKQNMQSRGLGNTTVGGNLERGVGYDTNLALGEIDDSLAQLRSGLRVGKGQAMYQGYGGLAGAHMARGQQEYDQWTDHANVSLGTASNIASASQANTNSWMQLGGAALGAALAIPTGGASLALTAGATSGGGGTNSGHAWG